MASGGPRKPQKPAAVSGPGKFAARTDGGVSQPSRAMTGGEYGDNAEMASLQGSAPMNASGRVQGSQLEPQGMPAPSAPLAGFGDPSARPGEPVTAGNPLGPGPGAPQLGTPMSAARLSDTLKSVAAANGDGSLDDLIIAMEEAGL